MAGARIVFATGNAGKLAELRALVADLPIEIVSGVGLPPVEEDGATFEENAAKKAVAAARHSGLPALADDSGLEVDALGGAPGVHSARYAGSHGDDQANNRALLRALDGVPDERRTARFVCVLAFCDPARGSALETRRGACEGLIGHAPRGAGGFGYDPLFVLPDLGRTMAELPPTEKNARSHRARAMRRMVAEVLRPWLAASLAARPRLT